MEEREPEMEASAARLVLRLSQTVEKRDEEAQKCLELLTSVKDTLTVILATTVSNEKKLESLSDRLDRLEVERQNNGAYHSPNENDMEARVDRIRNSVARITSTIRIGSITRENTRSSVDEQNAVSASQVDATAAVPETLYAANASSIISSKSDSAHATSTQFIPHFKVRQHFRNLMFGGEPRNISWKNLSKWLITSKKRFINWPPNIPSVGRGFHLTVLTHAEARSLLTVGIEDWTSQEQQNQQKIPLVTNINGLTLLDFDCQDGVPEAGVNVPAVMKNGRPTRNKRKKVELYESSPGEEAERTVNFKSLKKPKLESTVPSLEDADYAPGKRA
ncbi:hypothetical protein M422DRAFT_778492 [Sphaerobolus stellatus SS14]|nr:hypothetical protein M422DRAFT_778492 [Sphaerobolus stellatus SS14]